MIVNGTHLDLEVRLAAEAAASRRTRDSRDAIPGMGAGRFPVTVEVEMGISH